MATESMFSLDYATVPQHAERLENENAELRKQLEVMTLKARISELERTNKVLQDPTISSSTCESSANQKANVSISTSATTVNASTDAAASTDIAVSSDTAASIDTAASSEAAFHTLRRDCYIECPFYKVNMHQDLKFDEDPFSVGMALNLKGIISKTEYRKAIQAVNQSLKKCRTPGSATATLLLGAMLPFLFIPAAIGNRKRKKKRLKLMQSATEWFNAEHPGLFMKWETKPRQRLIIMRRDDARRLEIID